MLAARTTPLFETLQDQPAATLRLPGSVQGVIASGNAQVSLNLSNGSRYARLIRVREVWDVPEAQAPYLVMYSDNYFDLSPGETREVALDLRISGVTGKPVQGRLIVEGSNVAAANIPITLRP